MFEKMAIKLGDVQKTLLLPLWGRAVETQKPKPLLIDKKAVEIIDKIDYDFSAIANNINYITQLAWIGRSIITDRIVKRFIEQHENATIVNIGCGLDTTFERLSPAEIEKRNLAWYDLDLPDVIELRKKFIQENERRKYIVQSFLDYSWLDKLNKEDSILFIAAGVLYYFEESQVKNFFIKVAGSFPGCEIFFDAASPLGVRASNKLVIKNSGMDENAFLKWGLKNVKDIQLWDSRIKLIKKYSFFKDTRKRLPFDKKLGTYISDILKVMYMVHLKIIKWNGH